LFEIIDDQAGLRSVVNVEPGLVPAHLDLHLGPLARNEVHVRLVLAGSLLAEPEPLPAGEGDVLDRVIAAQLVVGTGVGGPEVEAFIF